jgi:predicted enzyme related to lactoylglutathione lyase
MPSPHGKLAHFAIEADDVDRAKQFYERVFDWSFVPWGPPDFYRIEGAGVHGALQERQNPIVDGLGPMQLTFAVDDLEATIRAIRAAGGSVQDVIHEIPAVGRLAVFADSEDNSAMIMEYESAAAEEMGLG